MVAAFDNMRSYSWSRAHTCRRSLTRWHWHTLTEQWCHGWSHPPLPGLTYLSSQPRNLTRIRTACHQKKKKEREKMLWPSGPLTLTKKSKFSKRTCPTQFFTFQFWDPFLHSKLRNCANVQFPKVDFCTYVDQKVKIFKKGLSCPIFHVDSIFGVYFFIQESEIAQIVWFYSCWP